MTALQQHRIIALRITDLLADRANENVVESEVSPQVDFARHLFGLEPRDLAGLTANAASHVFETQSFVGC